MLTELLCDQQVMCLYNSFILVQAILSASVTDS